MAATAIHRAQGGRVWPVGIALTTALVLVGAPAKALDVHLSSTTSSQVYQVRTSSDGFYVERRRVTDRLVLRLSRLLPAETDEGYRGPRMSLTMLLRADADFGARQIETDPSSETWFVPGYDPYAVDLTLGYLSVEDLLWRTTDLHLGRLVSLDATGFSALDGLSLRARLPWHLDLWAASGLEVAAGKRLSTGTFEVDGVIRQSRDGLAEGDHPEARAPATRVVVLGGAALTGFDWARAEIAYRHGILPDEGEARTSYQRLAGSAAVDTGWLQVVGTVSGDLSQRALNEASGEVVGRPLRWLRVGAGARYDAPVFDIDSLFVAFWSEPAAEARARLELIPMRDVHIGAVGIFRFFGLGDDGESQASATRRLGGEAYARGRWGWLGASLRARFASGYAGMRAGGDMRLRAFLLRDRLSLDLRGTVLSLWHDLEPGEQETSLGYVAGASFALTRGAVLTFEAEHNYNRLVGHRLRVVVLLDMRAWL